MSMSIQTDKQQAPTIQFLSSFKYIFISYIPLNHTISSQTGVFKADVLVGTCAVTLTVLGSRFSVKKETL